MVTACCVCRRPSDIYRNLSYHKFPFKDTKKKESWCSLMGLSSEKVTNYWRICGLHFTKDSYKEMLTGTRKFLKPDAAPSIVHVTDEEMLENAKTTYRDTIAKFERDSQLYDDEENDDELYDERQSPLYENQENDEELYVERESPLCETPDNDEQVYVETETKADVKFIKIFVDTSRDKAMAANYKARHSNDANNTNKRVKLKNVRTLEWEDIADSPTLQKAYFEKTKKTIAHMEKKLIRQKAQSVRLRKTVKYFRYLMIELKGNYLFKRRYMYQSRNKNYI